MEAIKNRMLNGIRFLLKPPFYFCAAILILIFLVTRLPFFVYYPVVNLGADTPSYLRSIQQAQSGIWPSFVIRSPGYPLFIWLVTIVSDRWLAVILVQNLLSLAASLYLVYGVYRTHAALAIPATLAMLGFLGSTQALTSDMSALSDSLYASCLIVSFAFLLLALQKVGTVYFLLASVAMAAAIIVRPAGLYFAVIYVFVVVFMVWNHYATSMIMRFVTPFPLILLMLCVYNYFTIHVFGLNAFGEADLAGATISFWEPDQSFPPMVNAALAELPKSLEKVHFTEKDRQIMDTSWNADQLYPIFGKIYIPMIYQEGWGAGQRLSSNTYLDNRTLIRQVAMTAIQKHPTLYVKFVWANMVYFFKMPEPFNFYDVLSRSAQQRLNQLMQPKVLYPSSVKETATTPLPSSIQVVGNGTHARVFLSDTELKSLHLLWQSFYWHIYGRGFWVWVYFAVFAVSACMLLLSRGRHLGAFILFLLASSVLGAGLVVCLVDIASQRFAYPTQFVYYLSPALLPLLWLRDGVHS